MGSITLGGNPVTLAGTFPKTGEKAKDFNLVGQDLSEVKLSAYAGKQVVLNIFPSLDTPICATAIRKFNETAGTKDNTVVLCISGDLPFAHKRFCVAEGIENVVTASAFRNPEFALEYGVAMQDGPLAGLTARAVVVLNTAGEVVYAQLVPEIKQEPDYESALAALS
ncbi:thiol peroxidase [Desulfobacter postgatei]|jgi:thiol peroxidase|uniref:thiol peroxidase n=1 Tax=Desulfobacter postgatei TaxID=2293 RepID=UPI002A35E845|nr:thiol peroxidase [Desulfobacter postgatei]MDX9963900.1 thiol peroxidase [Desulfobacter postgatei]